MLVYDELLLGACMGYQRGQIDIIQRQISVVDHDVEVLYGELGLLILNLEEKRVPEGSEEIYETLRKEKKNLDNLTSLLLHVRQVGQSLQDATQRMNTLKKMKSELHKTLSILYSRLGVIAWEESSSGVLSEKVSDLLPQIEKNQQKVALLRKDHESASKRSKESSLLLRLPFKVHEKVTEHRFKRVAKGDEEFFISSGKAIAEAHCIHVLHSETAKEILEEHQAMEQKILLVDQELEILDQRASIEQRKLEKAGVEFSLEKKIQELEVKQHSIRKQVNRLAIVYGKAYYQKEKTIEKTANYTESIITCIDQIDRHEKIRKNLERRIEELTIEQEITELVMIIEQDEEKIIHLRQTIEQFNRQIHDIQRTIVHNREKIIGLKKNLFPYDNEE